MTTEAAVWSDADKEKVRFEAELEFVQALANPKYLNYLAQRLILEDEAFIAYLKYLRYWKRPEYAQFVIYPHALYFLDLLQEEDFRNKLKNEQVCEYIHSQQFFHWQYFHGKPEEESAPVTIEDEKNSASAAKTGSEASMDTS